MCKGPSHVREGVVALFKEHFKRKLGCRPSWEGLQVNHISVQERMKLEVEFSEDEVWKALSECDGNKAPGPDGLHINFIKANWELIKGDFMIFMHTFYHDGSVIKGFNCTFIGLIPKIKILISLQDFRPISLVGSLYKVLAKVLANRLKMVMDSVIGPSQMAFVKGRQIMDSFVISKEIIHSWKKTGKRGLLVKLDFEKAFDSVDHEFLLETLERMGFGLRWRNWIKGCISSPLLSVLVNGCPTKQFSKEKGMRQGDHLSPFLFNLVVEVLSCMLNKAKQLDMLNVVVFGNSAVHISHLQFADDTILFLELKLEYLMNAKRILRCFELILGLKINFHKSCLVMVGKRGAQEEDWAGKFWCLSSSFPIKYLGLPLGGNPSREAFWNPVVNKVEQRLASWKRGFISKRGRLVLTKAVLSSLPSYFMSVFSIPVEVKWDSVPLMNDFPRIYTLATNKSGVIVEFGSWVDLKWAWYVNLHKALFDWELDQWNCFKMCLENIKLRVGIPDALAWSHCSNGDLSPKGRGICLAIIERKDLACQLISEKVSLACRPITIITDSKSAVAWIKESEFGNLQLVYLVYDIRLFLKSSYGFDLRYMPRESNSMVDSLAKVGSSGGWDRLEWGDV
ncbi:hypothetical protein Dsin_023180 [Dipteronia sinensis]|uniref:Reverse transcriptase domain-containing protein n=1 Tax=Dipteronia sinensis TaxID=43782 RepID=A0AAE0E0F6_9ROSI|nr:hypothetical protein Dsin_023180 [Dipteronia sinensis]